MWVEIPILLVEKYIVFHETPLPKRQPGKPRPRKPDIATVKLWASKPALPAAFVLTGDAVAASLVDGSRRGHKLTALRRGDGTELWSVPLPAQPAMNRLAVDRRGRVIVGLVDGSVICIGR